MLSDSKRRDREQGNESEECHAALTCRRGDCDRPMKDEALAGARYAVSSRGSTEHRTQNTASTAECQVPGSNKSKQDTPALVVACSCECKLVGTD